jgi:hypothetical protein
MISTGSNSLDFLRLLLKISSTFYSRPQGIQQSAFYFGWGCLGKGFMRNCVGVYFLFFLNKKKKQKISIPIAIGRKKRIPISTWFVGTGEIFIRVRYLPNLRKVCNTINFCRKTKEVCGVMDWV